MTIVFLTNFINHHQVPLGDEFCKLPGIQYYFIAMEELPLEFEKRGYPNYSDRSYLIKAYENRMALKWAEKLILSADVVIIGSADDTFIKERLKRNMLTFRYNERWFKQEKHLISPKGLMILYRDHFCYRKKNCICWQQVHILRMMFMLGDTVINVLNGGIFLLCRCLTLRMFWSKRKKVILFIWFGVHVL